MYWLDHSSPGRGSGQVAKWLFTVGVVFPPVLACRFPVLCPARLGWFFASGFPWVVFPFPYISIVASYSNFVNSL